MAPERIRASATVVLHRRGEVYLVERSRAVRFFPGYHAFPGGTLEAEEQARVAKEGLAAFAAAAVREVAEEVGIDLAPDDLVPAGRLLTPPFAPVRYDTQFFLAGIPDGIEPRIVEVGELVSGRWWRPADALAAFARGALLVPPPTLAYLRRVVEAGSFEDAAAAIAAEDGLPHHKRFHIELHPDLHALPLRTRTLPPATTTVTYLVAAPRDLVVVDPGPVEEDEQIVLSESVGNLLADGRRPTAVLLTHHHADHVGAADLLKRRFGFPVLAHEETASRLPEGLVDRAIGEGDALDLGTYAPTGAPWRIEVLHTPGHAPGHLAFRDSRFGALLVGDLVSSVSTILVSPGEGDMGAYLASLDRLAASDPPIVFPAHGPAAAGKRLLAETAAHRRDRQAKVEAALAKGATAVEDVVREAYADTPDAHPALAAMQVESILAMLAKEGRAAETGGAWRLVG